MISYGNIQISNFPDGTLHLACPMNYGENMIKWFYENDAELFTLICLKRHLDEAGCPSPSLYLPYLPHARMDRVKNEEDVFTLKYFCEVINSLNFERVICYDIHSSVGAALLNNCENRLPISEINAVINAITNDVDPVLCYPDEGAMKRYSTHFQRPYAFGIKRRNWQTGKIEGLSIINDETVAGRDVLIVDDICSYGGTFMYTAQALKNAGAKRVFLFITHCENSILYGDLLSSGLLDGIYTMKTLVHLPELEAKFKYVG